MVLCLIEMCINGFLRTLMNFLNGKMRDFFTNFKTVGHEFSIYGATLVVNKYIHLPLLFIVSQC